MNERLHIRIHGECSAPTLIYLPGLHGDWTLIASFRNALRGRFRFVEITYPRTLDWSLEDHARAICQQLAEHQISQGWLLAESFGSQIAWPLVTQCFSEPNAPAAFHAQGIILAGGFARHPTIPGVRLMKNVLARMPASVLRCFVIVYRRYAKFRHRHAPETLTGIDDFIARRTREDRLAIVHRLELIAANDPRELVKSVHVPVYILCGAIDPIVYWPTVQSWVRMNCPGHCASKTVWYADHNILATSPEQAAQIITRWIHPRL